MEFKNYHPLVNIVFYIAVIFFSCIYTRPLFLIISLISALIYSLILKRKTLKKDNLLLMLPVIVVYALINPLFSHEGETILFYLPGGAAFTKEALLYGFALALMLWSVLFHFSCFNIIVTSDRLQYVLAKITPSLALVITMVLGFIPKISKLYYDIQMSLKAIGRNMENDGLITRTQNAATTLSVMFSRSMEDSIETADSMRARGYGAGKRTSYSTFIFTKRDAISLIVIFLLSAVIIYSENKMPQFEYYPVISEFRYNIYSLYAIASYILLFTYPIITEFIEVIKWKKLDLKI